MKTSLHIGAVVALVVVLAPNVGADEVSVAGSVPSIESAFQIGDTVTVDLAVSADGEVGVFGVDLELGVASTVMRAIAPRGAPTNSGIRIASGMGGDIKEAVFIRVVERGEKIADILDEAKVLTYTTGNEHALVKLATGERVLVSGGPGGMTFGNTPITRVLGHTHPYGSFGPVVPSSDDIDALLLFGHKTSYILEKGQLIKFSAPSP